jgi:hypothetical protein
MKNSLLGLLALGFASSSASAATPFSITLNYTGSPLYAAAFTTAESIWESIIPAYIDGTQGAGTFAGITISASTPAIDGAGGVLGSAGPTFGGTDNSGYLLATQGNMQFDIADVANLAADGSLITVILHEMGHVLGLGTLWTNNGDYVNGSGQYTGVNGLAAYRAEFNQPGATFVPVELGGGAGTANGHWNEVDGGSGFTGIVSSISNQDMRFELMTGWLNSDQPYFISNLTRGSLQDLGYNAVLLPVPEISSSLLGALSLGIWMARRKRVA